MKEYKIANCGDGKIIDNAMSDINYIQSLDDDLKSIVVGVYTRSMGYCHRTYFA